VKHNYVDVKELNIVALPPTRPADRTKSPDSFSNPGRSTGRLIGTVADEVPNHPKEILNIGRKNNFTSNMSGNLWLTVNDIWLDPETVKQIQGKTDEWKLAISTNRYWNVWFDDNTGAFFVTVEIEP
jgi:hypothetical protein